MIITGNGDEEPEIGIPMGAPHVLRVGMGEEHIDALTNISRRGWVMQSNSLRATHPVLLVSADEAVRAEFHLHSIYYRDGNYHIFRECRSYDIWIQLEACKHYDDGQKNSCWTL